MTDIVVTDEMVAAYRAARAKADEWCGRYNKFCKKHYITDGVREIWSLVTEDYETGHDAMMEALQDIRDTAALSAAIRSCLLDKPEAVEVVTENMRVAACRALNERGKGNNVTISDVVAMLEAALSTGSEASHVMVKRIDVDGACIRCGGVECMPEGALTCTICIDAILDRSELNGADRRPFAARAALTKEPTHE